MHPWNLEETGRAASSGSIAELHSDDQTIRIEAVSENIIHCIYAKNSIKSSSPLEINPSSQNTTDLQISEKGGSILMRCGEIALQIDKNSGRFIWNSAKDGSLLLREGEKELVEEPLLIYSTGGEKPVVRREKTVDGERNFIENLKPHQDGTAFRAKLHFEWQECEAIHGLGQGEEGIYNYRGNVQYLYQHNMRIPIPFFVSDRHYGILFNCGSIMTFNDDSRGSYIYFDTVDKLDYYFIYGEKLDDIIAGYRGLTGNAAMLPKWAFGYVQSKEVYNTSDELLDTVKQYRKRKVPIDCIVQDWHTWKNELWGDKHLDKTRYPDIKATNAEIHSMNVHTMVSIWPNMNMGGQDYNEFNEAGYLLGDNSTYDAFNDNARKMYWKQAESELFSGGFDSWWCDSTEPFSGPDWSGEKIREPWERFQLIGNEHKKFLGPKNANLFALYHAKGIFENQKKAAPEKRVLNLTRSGYAGSQKYGTVLWSGDISATWSTLKRQITEGLNFCMSGMPYWTLDIGGFFVVKDAWQNRGCGCSNNPNPLWLWQGGYDDGVKDPAYRELYVRWLEYGAFLPMFRSHGTDTPREIWNFGEKGGPFYDAIEKFINLRYSLMPYIYSMAGRVALKDYTMLRSLLFDFGDDETAKTVHDEFMFGDSILVCPVTEPMYYEAGAKPLDKAKKRTCYLPKAAAFYDFWTGKRYEGGQFVEMDAPIDRIPLFIREGSILPMEKGLQYAQQTVEESFEIHIYPGSDGCFTLYEDSGDGFKYENGEYNSIEMRWDDRNKSFSVGAARYDFPQSIKGRDCELVLGDRRRKFRYEGKPLEISMKA